MNALTNDLIAIDTNVFLHLLHQGAEANAVTVNAENHIDDLLSRLRSDGISLLLDDKNAIGAEYHQYVHPLLRDDETDAKRYLLRHWMVEARKVETPVDLKSKLYISIERVIHEKKEKCDRIFVYVACRRGRYLVTNDRTHILWGPNAEGNTAKDNRYTRLKRETKKLREKGADFVSSLQAHALLDQVTDNDQADLQD